jgi:hypothetical protein
MLGPRKYLVDSDPRVIDEKFIILEWVCDTEGGERVTKWLNLLLKVTSVNFKAHNTYCWP